MSNSKPRLKVGLIGTGFMGKAHAFGFTNAARVFDLPVEAELHTVADIKENAALAAARAYAFSNATTDWHDIIGNPDIDIVSITAPNALHKEMSLAAIAAGKHVYCEKPLSPLAKDAREMGYTSVNYDLIYGLPKQTPERIRRSAELTLELLPERIAFYSFAKVPWIKPAQRLFKDEDLPEGADKRELYEIAREHKLVLDEPAVNVQVDELADSSVNLFCRPWTKTTDYWTVHWDLTRQVKERFDAEGISIPYPQQDVYMHEVKAAS